MEQLQNFFNLNKENLIQISIKERSLNDYGALFISIKKNLDNTPKQINVYYFYLNHYQI